MRGEAVCNNYSWSRLVSSQERSQFSSQLKRIVSLYPYIYVFHISFSLCRRAQHSATSSYIYRRMAAKALRRPAFRQTAAPGHEIP